MSFWNFEKIAFLLNSNMIQRFNKSHILNLNLKQTIKDLIIKKFNSYKN